MQEVKEKLSEYLSHDDTDLPSFSAFHIHEVLTHSKKHILKEDRCINTFFILVSAGPIVINSWKVNL